VKDLFIILGNGFSIDFLNHLKSDVTVPSDISLTNLFENGELVPWPGDDSPGFLSYKHCPNLWTLGARSNLDATKTINLIENIITCANTLNKQSRNVDSIYIRAYKELVTYLKALFIYYNNKISVPNIDLSSWGWCKYLINANRNIGIGKIHIVTLNYDIWLERILKKHDIRFIESTNEKIMIYKPHGSISFAHNITKIKDVFEVDYKQDIMDGKISEFSVNYEELTALNSINAMIPPAGDSNRLDFEWASEIRKSILNASKNLKDCDELIICGTSYWHVDRLEVDGILTSISADISDVKVVNPSSPEVFNAVITTLFTNVKFFKDSSPLT
jgi:hypothetical protein